MRGLYFKIQMKLKSEVCGKWMSNQVGKINNEPLLDLFCKS